MWTITMKIEEDITIRIPPTMNQKDDGVVMKVTQGVLNYPEEIIIDTMNGKGILIIEGEKEAIHPPIRRMSQFLLWTGIPLLRVAKLYEAQRVRPVKTII